MKGIIGRKLGMTQIFNAKGLVVPVTVIEAGPCTIVQIKNAEKEGYDAAILAFSDVKESKLTKPEQGIFKKVKVSPKKYLREFTLQAGQEVGSEVKADIFKAGDVVDVSGTTKGHGFSGNIKRHNTHRLKETHGTGPTVRHVGSTGANSTPGHVFKNRKMPGQYGNVNATVSNLEVVKIDLAKNVILVKGAVPGQTGSIVVVRAAAKVKA